MNFLAPLQLSIRAAIVYGVIHQMFQNILIFVRDIDISKYQKYLVSS